MSPHFLNLFSFNKKTIPLDLEKTVGHYLLSLPRCTNNILVISRSYGDKRYNYELTVDAACLAAWAVKHEKGAWIEGTKTEQAIYEKLKNRQRLQKILLEILKDAGAKNIEDSFQ